MNPLTIQSHEIAHLITGYDPFPIYQKSIPTYERKTPYTISVDVDNFDDARRKFTTELREDLEYGYLFGESPFIETPGELAKFKDCTEYIGGMVDTCRWVSSEVRKLSEADQLELLEICRKEQL